MKSKFQQYASSLLQANIDAQNAFEAACDEFNLDYDSEEIEAWFEEIQAAHAD